MSDKAKPATYEFLAAVHQKLSAYMNKILDDAIREPDPEKPDDLAGMPLDAATMSTIARFLAQNEITCDPADKGKLNDLREKYGKASQEKAGRSRVAASVGSILDEASRDDRQYLN